MHEHSLNLIRGEAPIAVEAKYLGLSTIQMTMRYSHLMPGANLAVVDVQDEFRSRRG